MRLLWIISLSVACGAVIFIIVLAMVMYITSQYVISS